MEKTLAKKRKLALEQQQLQLALPTGNYVADQDDPVPFDGGDKESIVSTSSPDQIFSLLMPFDKDQLIGFLIDAIADDAPFLANIRAVADQNVSHRNVFVHGIGWDTTRETLIHADPAVDPGMLAGAFVDKTTGRCKGYAFVLFRTRAGAINALKEPEKKIKNRLTHCQLASIGPPAASSGGDTSGRKVYISNVHTDAAPDKLKAFFSQFGEIETGPFGFDMITGKSRGYAIFVYKTLEGARRALEEPHKVFEGHQLHCRLAIEHGQQKGKAPTLALNPTVASSAPAATPQSVLAAVAAAQNIALYNQNPAAYSFLLGQNPILAAAVLNPTVAAAAAQNPTVGLLASQSQQIGVATTGSGASSFVGDYNSQALADLQVLQSYKALMFGQASSMGPSNSSGGFS
ncbi:hypothetical protein ZIOFF_011413 [Zingiber officinale]|uniref:RRM domain-containing protein n=1 Tax=Zingiber officinale TaxID=94328 RepID=A0A8J5LZN6_ZINOF|nr:hypothetical protein ZIOFF_011413 [Zingiber officinale]